MTQCACQDRPNLYFPWTAIHHGNIQPRWDRVMCHSFRHHSCFHDNGRRSVSRWASRNCLIIQFWAVSSQCCCRCYSALFKTPRRALWHWQWRAIKNSSQKMANIPVSLVIIKQRLYCLVNDKTCAVVLSDITQKTKPLNPWNLISE